MPLFIGLGLTALAAAILYFDLRFRRIPDWITFAALGLFAIWVLVDPDLTLIPRLIQAAGAFALCFLLFALRILGGGDAKVIPALALFVSPAFAGQTMLLFAGMFLLALCVTALHRKRRGQANTGKMPLGGAIGGSTLIALAITFF